MRREAWKIQNLNRVRALDLEIPYCYYRVVVLQEILNSDDNKGEATK